MRLFVSICLLVATLCSMIEQLNTQASPQGTCDVWGDPHLVNFPSDPQQQGLRMGYWCQWKGRMLILKNQYIEFYVNVTKHPFWNEFYEIKFLDGTQCLCTITPISQTCSSPLLTVSSTGTGLQIQYENADYLDVSINSYTLGNGRNVYDIHVIQSYPITMASSGVCITKLPSCRLESSANPFGRRKRDVVSDGVAAQVCDEYMKEANRTAMDLVGNTGSPTTAHARAACINDVKTTGDPSWGESAVGFVVKNALKKASLTPAQRRGKLPAVFAGIRQAAAQARVNADIWIGIESKPAIFW